MLGNILEFIASELEKTSGIEHKIIRKHLDIKKGINDIEILNIDTKKIVSISGAVWYSNHVLPLSYPMINYSTGGYIEWGLAAIIANKSLKLISGAEWQNCDVQIVISYVGGVKRSKIKLFKLIQRLVKKGGAK